MSYQTKITVRYAETDQMKVVYYANYFIWMEQARTEHLNHMGFPYNLLEEKGFFLPVLEAHAQYKRSAHYGDNITVETHFTNNGIKIRVDYKILCKDTLLATGYTVHVFTNTKNKPIKPPKGLINSISQD